MPNYYEYSRKYQDELLHNILPFWIKNSNDEQHGGYFTCLDRKGKVYDTDKFIWLQARQVYTFSFMFNHVGANDLWLGFAFQGSGFLQQHGRDHDGNWYFSVDQQGKPLVQPYSIFSDCFAALAFGSIYKATDIDEFAEISRNTFKNILARRDNPKGIYSKGISSTRILKNSSMPMIMCMLLQEIETLLDNTLVNELYNECIHELTETFYDHDTGILFENVDVNGNFSDTMDGRLICPGTIVEGMWFIMDLADKRGDKVLIEKASKIVLSTMEYAWDTEYGGLYYFMDYKSHPLQQLEGDQKLWWVHVEALISLLKAFHLTKKIEFWNWFVKVHDYTWKHFPDKEHGEWFGYLNRQGEINLSLKGGKWKGCYHIPRALYQCWRTLEKLSQNEKQV